MRDGEMSVDRKKYKLETTGIDTKPKVFYY